MDSQFIFSEEIWQPVERKRLAPSDMPGLMFILREWNCFRLWNTHTKRCFSMLLVYSEFLNEMS